MHTEETSTDLLFRRVTITVWSYRCLHKSGGKPGHAPKCSCGSGKWTDFMPMQAVLIHLYSDSSTYIFQVLLTSRFHP